jgi:tetratricopeptide (TPR) repeat protein
MATMHLLNNDLRLWKQCNEKALSLFHDLELINPSNPWAYYGLAVCHKRLGNLHEATIMMERSIRFDRRVASAHYNMACLAALKGDSTQCVESLRNMVEWVKPILESYRIEHERELRSVATNPEFKNFMATFRLQYRGSSALG